MLRPSLLFSKDGLYEIPANPSLPVRRAVSVLGSKCLNPIRRLPDVLKSMRLDKGSEIAYSFPPPCWKSNPASYSAQLSTKSAQRLSNTIESGRRTQWQSTLMHATTKLIAEP